MKRRGLTLAELLIAVALTSLLALGIGVLLRGVLSAQTASGDRALALTTVAAELRLWLEAQAFAALYGQLQQEPVLDLLATVPDDPAQPVSIAEAAQVSAEPGREMRLILTLERGLDPAFVQPDLSGELSAWQGTALPFVVRVYPPVETLSEDAEIARFPLVLLRPPLTP